MRTRLIGAVSWLLLAAGAAFTLMAATSTREIAETNDRGAFERTATDVSTSILSTLHRDTNLVDALVSTLALDSRLTNEQFERWLENTNALGRFPGGLGYTFLERVEERDLAAFARRLRADPPPRATGGFTVSPPGSRPDYCFVRVAAYTTDVRLPLGLDFCASDVSLPGVLDFSPALTLSASRLSGTMAVVPLSLLRGMFVVAAPVSRGGRLPSLLTQRDASLLGWAIGAFDARALLAAAGAHREGLRVEVWHRNTGKQSRRIVAAGEPTGPKYVYSRHTDMWTVKVRGALPEQGLSPTGQFKAVLAVGLTVSLLIFGLVQLLVRGRGQALRLVARRTEELRQLALHDPLTGLPNRALILDLVERALARARRRRGQIAVMFLDLDGFKAVNDTLGHAAGDELLRTVAARLTGFLRESDTVGRLGGDEFVVLVEGDTLDAGAEAVADRIREVLSAPIPLQRADGAASVRVRSSIGIAVGPRERAEDLLRDADIALYAAKEHGRDRYALFAPEMHAELARRVELEQDLRVALEQDELFLVYQPIVNLVSNEIHGAEALLRWRHPLRGVVGPDEFIPVAETSGLIIEIGAWVLREACLRAAGWQLPARAFSVSVNMSGRQLEEDAGIVATVSAALAESGLPPELLTLEITETVLLRDGETVATRLRELKALGVRVAIDDFGTGYSSIAYLRQFPCDTLKIDRSFVRGIGASGEAAALVSTLVRLGRDLGIETLAEGIEDSEQLRRLVAERCDSGQGYLFARPLNPDAIDDLLGFVATR